MSHSKTGKASSIEKLVAAGKSAGIELTETELSTVAGGDKATTQITTTVSQDKAKAANKAYQAMDAYIKQ